MTTFSMTSSSEAPPQADEASRSCSELKCEVHLRTSHFALRTSEAENWAYPFSVSAVQDGRKRGATELWPL